MRTDVQWVRQGEQLSGVRAQVAMDLLDTLVNLRTTQGERVERLADASEIITVCVELGTMSSGKVALERFGEVLQDLCPEDALSRRRTLAVYLPPDGEIANDEVLARWAEFHTLRMMWHLAGHLTTGEPEDRLRAFAGMMLSRLALMLPHLRACDAVRVRRGIRAFRTEPRVVALGELA